MRTIEGAFERAFRSEVKSATGLNVEPLQSLVEVIRVTYQCLSEGGT
jgi:hypothetical protein